MSADVYATDDALKTGRPADPIPGTIAFTIWTDASPDVLLRVAVQLNFLNRMPQRLTLESQCADQARVDVVVTQCTDFMAELICGKLRQLSCSFDAQWERLTS